jgi:hypothetical protein
MNTTPKQRGIGAWLFNPFIYIAGWQSLMLGIAAILAAAYIGSLSHAHFDGVLDMHQGNPAPLWFFISEGLMDWLALGIILLVFGKFISRTKFRTLDLLGTQAMARWPMIITSLIVYPIAFRNASSRIVESLRNPSATISFADEEMILFFISSFVILLIVCWFVVLAYRSFSVSCNVSGGKAIATFIAGILIAEIISKIAIVQLDKNALLPGIK